MTCKEMIFEFIRQGKSVKIDLLQEFVFYDLKPFQWDTAKRELRDDANSENPKIKQIKNESGDITAYEWLETPEELKAAENDIKYDEIVENKLF